MAPIDFSLRSAIGISLLIGIGGGLSLAQNNGSECPQISFAPIHGVFPTKRKSVLRAQVSNRLSEKFSLIWGLSSGRIISGNGTKEIEIYFDRKDAGANVTVFLKIENPPDRCQGMFSEMVVVEPEVEGDPYDRFGELRPNDVKARIDSFYITIKNNPDYEGLIVANFDSKQSRARKLKSLNAILNAIRFRKYDITKFSFVIEESSAGYEFVLWLLPPEADLPGDREKTTLIKGEDLIKNPGKAFPKKNCK